MLKNKNINDNYTARQLKLPLVIEKIINISDPVYTFCDVMDHIDLTPYFVEEKGYKTGRPRCDAEKLLKVILFAFMENGYCSLREIEKLCNTDIRFMYLLDEMKAPTFATFGNFIRNELTSSIEEIFNAINAYIFNKEKVDLNHTYIDGTKIEANANKYTWVWKKSCITNRDKVFGHVSALINEINSEVLCTFGIKIEHRDEYAIEYLEEILKKYTELTSLDFDSFVYGKGHRKTIYQRQYEKLNNYKEIHLHWQWPIQVCYLETFFTSPLFCLTKQIFIFSSHLHNKFNHTNFNIIIINICNIYLF
ncbi:Transposase [Eubacterium uniforme]|uniref:Transposase n=1 Tax=Eubacterium uniforme TaxID=39495 RepID=A0A1T4VVE7_9FIRM|nr:transposase [Eubacterium uniforme]SKA68994.1 Transposase [Eubacterium uniforme]